MPDIRKCSLAQESNLGGEGAKESGATSRSPRRFCSWSRLVIGGFVELPRELTFIHVLLFPNSEGKGTFPALAGIAIVNQHQAVRSKGSKVCS